MNRGSCWYNVWLEELATEAKGKTDHKYVLLAHGLSVVKGSELKGDLGLAVILDSIPHSRAIIATGSSSIGSSFTVKTAM